MKRIFLKVTVVAMVPLFSVVTPALADEVTDLKNQVVQLNELVANLTNRINQLEGREAEKPVLVHPGHATPQAEGQGGLLLAAQDIQIGGYIDTQFNWNLTQSGATVAGGNVGRIFDTDRRSFTVNAAELTFEREANPDGGAGFRIDIQYGEDAAVVNADGSGTGDGVAGADKVDLQQAYVEYIQPLNFWKDSAILPDSIRFKVGRFVTLAGLEVIEAIDNWNISRSFAFGLTIPFTHTGIRTHFGLFDDFLDVYLGLNNGWDLAVDNNTYKTLEAAVGFSPLENLSLFHALYWGPEMAATNGQKRFLLTNVATFDITENFSVMGEFNFGTQRRTGIATGVFENAQWYSWAGYVRYQATEKLAFAYRAELLRDTDNFRTGGTFPVPDHTFWEQTLTAEYQLTDNMLARLEFRYDKADNAAAFGADESEQVTFGGQILYLIG